jgi:hypothetical protein
MHLGFDQSNYVENPRTLINDVLKNVTELDDITV